MNQVGCGCNKAVERATILSMDALLEVDWTSRSMERSKGMRPLGTIRLEQRNGSMPSKLILQRMVFGMD